MNTLEAIISQAWYQKETLNPDTAGPFKDAILECIDLLNTGQKRIAEKKSGQWVVNEWLKQAVLLSFRLQKNTVYTNGKQAFDKVPLKCDNWTQADFDESGFRMVPGSIVRTGSFIASDVIIMPSFINIGAFVDQGTMVDSGVTIGSCAQIGKNCHISSNAIIGGVLEPLQATPTIIEDNCFIGGISSVTEGVIVEEGSVISSGVHISGSTPIINRDTGETSFGRIPAYSVVVPGSRKTKSDYDGELSLSCAVIVKTVTAETRKKTALNDLLRP